MKPHQPTIPRGVLLGAVVLLLSSTTEPAAWAQQFLFGRNDSPISLNATSVAIGDFNGDGKLDAVVVEDQNSSVAVLLGKPDGTFQAAVAYSTLSGPISVAVADFNGDGRLDLAVTDGGSFVSILLGNGDGTFQTHVDYATGSGPYGVVNRRLQRRRQARSGRLRCQRQYGFHSAGQRRWNISSSLRLPRRSHALWPGYRGLQRRRPS
jgi:hypothetical protein